MLLWTEDKLAWKCPPASTFFWRAILTHKVDQTGCMMRVH